MIEARLSMPSDGAFALTARLFVASILRIMGVDDDAIEDLKLAVSELCAAAAGAGTDAPIAIRVTDEGGRGLVEFEGIASLDPGDSAGGDEAERLARTYRLQLLRSLFPELQVRDGAVRIAVPA
jgi:anti-sigma regulatory factor (Ser/Thr protein kinase)